MSNKKINEFDFLQASFKLFHFLVQMEVKKETPALSIIYEKSIEIIEKKKAEQIKANFRTHKKHKSRRARPRYQMPFRDRPMFYFKFQNPMERIIMDLCDKTGSNYHKSDWQTQGNTSEGEE